MIQMTAIATDTQAITVMTEIDFILGETLLSGIRYDTICVPSKDDTKRQW